MLAVADNSGAKKVMMIGLPRKGGSSVARLGDMFVGVVKTAAPHGQVKKSDKVYAVVVRVRKECRRADGSYIRFDDNACVVLTSKDNKDPKGTRIFGPIAKEVRDVGYNKIASLAQEMY